MKKRCEVARDPRDHGGWQVSFFSGGGLPPVTRHFEREDQALLAVSAWCGSERADGHAVDLVLPPGDEPAGRQDLER